MVITRSFAFKGRLCVGICPQVSGLHTEGDIAGCCDAIVAQAGQTVTCAMLSDRAAGWCWSRAKTAERGYNPSMDNPSYQRKEPFVITERIRRQIAGAVAV